MDVLVTIRAGRRDGLCVLVRVVTARALLRAMHGDGGDVSLRGRVATFAVARRERLDAADEAGYAATASVARFGVRVV